MSILSKISIFISLTLAVLCAGCSDDALRGDLPGDNEEEMAGNFFIHLRMNLCDNGIPGSRADGDTPVLDRKREKEIKTVDLLVYDVSDGKDLLIDIISLNESQVSAINSEAGLTVPIFAKEGMMVSIYAVANMPHNMRSQFIINQTEGRKANVTSTGADYWDVINEFVPESNGRQSDFETATGKGIPMTGQFKIDDGYNGDTENTEGKDKFKVTDKHKTKDTPLPITAELTRIVAKIHVLAKTIAPKDLSDGTKDVHYVYAIDNTSTKPAETANEEFSDWIGWIRLRNVRYIPNGTSKSTYLFQQPNDADQLSPYKDLKMDLGSYLLGRDNLDLGFDENLWSSDFVFYNGLSLHKINIDKDANNNEIKHVENAEQYDEPTLNNTLNVKSTDKCYTKGMYCLENYFNTPATGEIADKFSSYDDAIPMVTHVSIAARMIPRHLVITENYMEAMNAFVSEYTKNKGTFYKKYGLTDKDFNDEDIARWSGTITANNITLEGISSRYSDYFKEDKYIYRTQFRIIKAQREIDAMYILKWSLQVHNLWTSDPAKFETGKYSANTFYVYNLKFDDKTPDTSDKIEWNQSYLYLTAGAVNAANTTATYDNADIKTYSVPHLGGWGYYYTYLDNPGKGDVNASGRTPYTSSLVTRNTYYILTINNFGTPGGTITRPEYIKVNTQAVGWDYTGKGDVNLH